MEDDNLINKYGEHVINEYTEIRKVLESLAEESEESEAGPSTSSYHCEEGSSKCVKNTNGQSLSSGQNHMSLNDLPILTVEYILGQLGLTDVMRMRLISPKWNGAALRKFWF